VSNISAILGEESATGTGSDITVTDTVIPNPESGVLTVRATAAQHEQVQSFIDQVLVSAKRQVLIQTTIVEVTLNEDYKAGIDWSFINANGKSGFNFISTALAGVNNLPATVVPSFVISAVDNNAAREQSLTGSISLLNEFGDTKILSSPQVMALNNQTALLKVVENIVYFEVDAETTPGAVGAAAVTTIDTTAKTVPVGIVMTVTPQIDANGTITLNVRPTISRFVKDVPDPNPQLAGAGTTNNVPQIAVREMESVLRLNDGQIGVLGGLMQDQAQDKDAGIPGLKDRGFFGNLFKAKSAQYDKTELVIFLKPIIVSNPNIDSDLEEYKKYLSKDYQPLSPSSSQGDNAL
tara:strand:- start:16 stop:1068 length:1053 start_codon:yes stop_codon:yes gene_type:complete